MIEILLKKNCGELKTLLSLQCYYSKIKYLIFLINKHLKFIM